MTSSDEGGLIAGRYRLDSELGRGAMGVVWLARDERLRRTVAVKELRAGVGLSETQVEQSQLRARREARIAARLHHPNAVAVYDVAEHDGRPYLVMEYVESRSLSEVLAESTHLDPEQVAEIGVQLASALAAAHEAGIVHRDVKPGNILITEDGKAKLTDFGISRAVGDMTVTGTGEMLGTPTYVAPEVAQGRHATSASDVFSLGATLYKAVEGVPPFETGPNVMALLLRIVNDEMTPPRRSGRLTDTLLWMMRNDPAERPSMDVARVALQAAAQASSAETISTLSTEETVPVDAAAAAGPNVVDGQSETLSSPLVPTPADRSATRVVAPGGAGLGAGPDVRANGGAGARKRMLPWMGLAAAAVLTAGIVAAIAANGSPGGSHTLPPTASPSAAPSNTTAGGSGARSSGTTSSGTTASGTTASSTASASATASAAASASSSASVATQLTTAIADYYQLVPGQLNQAWGYLTPGYQQNHAGGMSGFTSFWSAIQSVTASGITAEPPSSVVATLVYHYKDGRVIQERTSFGLVLSDGIWKIASSAVLQSTTL